MDIWTLKQPSLSRIGENDYSRTIICEDIALFHPMNITSDSTNKISKIPMAFLPYRMGMHKSYSVKDQHFKRCWNVWEVWRYNYYLLKKYWFGERLTTTGEKVVAEKQLKRKANHQGTIHRTLWLPSNDSRWLTPRYRYPHWNIYLHLQLPTLNCRTGKYRGSSQVSIYHSPRHRQKLMISKLPAFKASPWWLHSYRGNLGGWHASLWRIKIC